LQKRTVSAILVWVAIALLILNGYLRSLGIFLICIAMVITAVVVYFMPRTRRQQIQTEGKCQFSSVKKSYFF